MHPRREEAPNARTLQGTAGSSRAHSASSEVQCAAQRAGLPVGAFVPPCAVFLQCWQVLGEKSDGERAFGCDILGAGRVRVRARVRVWVLGFGFRVRF